MILPINTPANLSQAIIQSLVDSPLLVGDLPLAAQFDRQCLASAVGPIELNFDQKLGHLYEDALASLLASSPHIELVEQNLQIRTDIHTTVGELDFLIRQADGKLTHLELATKFYLALETDVGVTFPGPDARDNYDRKIKRMLSHQLTLCEQFKSHLPLAYQDQNIEVRQLVYGCLFDHINADCSRPRYCNPACRRGKWLWHSEIAGYFPNDSQFMLIPKYLWPVPCELLEGITLEAWQPDALVTRCQMVLVEGLSIPFFVAPDEYPRQSPN